MTSNQALIYFSTKKKNENIVNAWYWVLSENRKN